MSSMAEEVQAAMTMAGHNRISTQALTTLAQAAAAEALGVSPQDVRAEWSDDDGLLALSVAAPIRVPLLTEVLRDPRRVEGFGGSVWDRAVAAKTAILERVTELSGSTLSRVDIRISGARISEGVRVR
jgi:CO/xanthine dehydrogenase Mo-binding subunit